MPPSTRAALLATLLIAGAPAAFARAETLISFQSPSHNIGCIVGSSSGARCDIRHRDWSPPTRPKSCPSFTDYGQGLEVGRQGRGRVVCAGDTALTNGRALAYGHSHSVGRYTCTSRASGMTCRNRRSGHGFTIAKQRYRLF